MKHTHVLPLALLISLLLPTLASAETLEHKNSDKYTLELGGFARTRLAMELSDAHTDPTPSASIVMARLLGRAKYNDLGTVKVELNLLAQQPILDLYTDINLGSPVGVQLGIFKVPLSKELLLPITSLPIYDRTLLSLDLGVRRRVGANAYAKLENEELKLKIQSGLFDPKNNFNERFDQGLLSVTSADLTFKRINTDIHLAYMDHILKPDITLDADGNVITYPKDQQIDIALYTEQKHLRALLEGLASLETTNNHISYAIHSFVAYRFDQESTGYSYEPAVSVDYLDLDDGEHMRMTGNMHWLILERKLQASLGYGYEPELGAQQHASHYMLMELQGGF